jgi:hypothetical protein
VEKKMLAAAFISFILPPFSIASFLFYYVLFFWGGEQMNNWLTSRKRQNRTQQQPQRRHNGIRRLFFSLYRLTTLVMTSYSFSTVNHVLPLGVQRAYVPRASRPHLAWAAPTSSSDAPHALGEHSRLKGDGTAARETRAAQEEREKDEEERRSGTSPSSSSVSEVTLRALFTTDGATGRQLTLYDDATSPGSPKCSSAVPSQRRVVALWSPPSHSSEENLSRLLGGDLPLFVSDDIGNIFHHRWEASSDAGEPSAKRHRGEHGETLSSAGAWTPIVSAHSLLPSRASASAVNPPSSSLEALFSVSRGAPGWAGLTVLSTETATNAPLLISAREFYHDVRVIDPVQHEVVRVYSTTHPPTGFHCPSVQAAPHCVLVTEGCLATLFDVRCPSAVLSLSEVYAAQAEWAAAKEAPAAEKLHQVQEEGNTVEAPAKGKRGNGEETAAGGSKAAAVTPAFPPLVPGRLTSTVGQVRDVCGTANPFEVACAVDRALCVYDLRKFSRLFTSSSVLKYVIGGVTPVAGGRGIVCAGIDSEVRLVPLYDKTETTASLSLAARAVALAQKTKQRTDTPKKGEGRPPVLDVESMGPGGTFRTRLSTSVSCTSVWQGGWVSTQDVAGVAAVGLSVDGELFLAQ